jgi:Xylose isomerase-like TIM barrel.
MFFTGMVSVTFRRFSIDEVINAAVRAGLDGIEWGGDVHIPHGDLAAARFAAAKCTDTGLHCFSYGSYYRTGQGQNPTPIIETASALGAPNIRIWAGAKGSEASTEFERAAVVSDLRAFAGEAAKAGLSVSLEWHGGTLTDTTQSALFLMHELSDLHNLFLYWQPNQFISPDENLASLRLVLPHLSNIHVFNWSGSNRFTLRSDSGVWRSYLDAVRSENFCGGLDHGLFLEFSPDESENAFYDDAEYLKSLLI